MSAQLPQPRQSSVKDLHAEFVLLEFLAKCFFGFEPFGCRFQFLISDQNRADGCVGQTMAHWLHWMQLSMTHSGTLMATPRFSYWVVATGKIPSGEKALTGSLSPCTASMGFITLVTHSGSSVVSAGTVPGIGPAFRVGHFHEVVEAFVHGIAVHIDDLVALFTEHLFDLVFQIGDGVVHRESRWPL
jgi:hypothetical protein